MEQDLDVTPKRAEYLKKKWNKDYVANMENLHADLFDAGHIVKGDIVETIENIPYEDYEDEKND